MAVYALVARFFAWREVGPRGIVVQNVSLGQNGMAAIIRREHNIT